ncbi:hypothetical protein CDAR_178931 [Caerostris darwini]|uniref:Uncharacterized protein n=1 Tax=Caerostris darwini TaxID=1538125 RepID=A0AAV4MR16_9ARAC|nr:hypothetical protein CDAR_178931 [Caerostris darwini]
MDCNLNWSHHINNIQDKINSIQQKFNRATRATWDLNSRVKKEVYLKVIYRLISYGHEIWFQDGIKQNIKVIKMQRSGLITVTKCYIDTIDILP